MEKLRNYLKISLSSLFFTLMAIGFCFSEEPVSFTFNQTENHFSFGADFKVAAEPEVAWAVLTDYDRLCHFVSNLKSHLRSRDGKDLLVHQIAGGGFLFITLTVETLLEVHEEPIHSILLRDIKQKDFKSYIGVWGLRPLPSGTEITYKLEIEKNKNTPGFITPELIRKATLDSLSQVRREMEKRTDSKNKGAVKTPAMGEILHEN